MGAVLMTLLVIVVLALSVVDSRDSVRRARLVDIAELRSWYDSRHARHGRALNRHNIEQALVRARTLRRWGPVVLSAGTLIMALTLTGFAAGRVPGVSAAWRTPTRVLELIPGEVLFEVSAVFVLLPILVIEGILAALYMADLDITRLERLLATL